MTGVKFILSIPGVLLAVSLFAQQDHIDIANVYWRTSPANTIDSIPNDKFNFDLYTADLKIPIRMKEGKHTLIIGSEFQYSNFTSENLGLSVTSVQLQLGYQFKKKGFKTLVMFLPKISGADFSEMNSTYIQYGGLVLNTKDRSDSFSWRYGAYYNSEFFGPMLVPLFGFDWKINKSQRLKVLAPVDVEYSVNPGAKNKARFGFRFIGINGSYRIQNNLYLDRADNNIWLFGEWYITENFVLHGKAGHSVLRKYRIYENDRRMGLKLGPINILDGRGTSSPLFNEGWSFELRMLVRMPVPED